METRKVLSSAIVILVLDGVKGVACPEDIVRFVNVNIIDITKVENGNWGAETISGLHLSWWRKRTKILEVFLSIFFWAIKIYLRELCRNKTGKNISHFFSEEKNTNFLFLLFFRRKKKLEGHIFYKMYEFMVKSLKKNSLALGGLVCGDFRPAMTL